MAVIRESFSGIIDDVTTTTHTITGLTSETSSTSIIYVVPQASLHFLRSLYQALLAAGYDDTVMDETDYSITVLGFKFFVLCTYQSGYVTPSYGIYPNIFTHGSTSNLAIAAYASSGYGRYYSICDLTTNKILDYNIVIKGDKNCVNISYGSYPYPNANNPLIFIAKAKHLITNEDMYFFTGYLYESQAYEYCKKRYRKKNDLYNVLSLADTNGYSTSNSFLTYYDDIGYQTGSKFIVQPVLGNYGSILILSMIMCNDTYFSKGGYYKIGADLYYCNGHKCSYSEAYEGQYALYKVSD